MATTALKRWGNSQGFIIPKKVCKDAGLSLGTEMEIRVMHPSGAIVISPVERHYRRTEKVSAEDVLKDWHGEYECPDDLSGDGSVGDEADWGGPVGNEAW